MRATVAVVLGCWITFLVWWTVAALWVKPAREQQPLWQRLLHLVVLALVILLLRGTLGGTLATRELLPRSRSTEVVADLLTVAGLGIAIWARTVLGRNWSARVTLKVGHELIDTGPYRVVRHPIYSGLLLMILGTAVMAGNLSGLLAVAIFFVAIWLKLRREEALMTANFPPYAEYKARTKALVPYLL
jgi:protein-S-isoprenylcysteine O-methyltransferase Ste14